MLSRTHEKPSLPIPTRPRWQPLRLGLVELFHYDSEEFWFRDGHLLLRGNNGTGKSKVLALMLPALAWLWRVVPERMGVIVLSAIAAHTAWHWMTERWEVLRQAEWPHLVKTYVEQFLPALTSMARTLTQAGPHRREFHPKPPCSRKPPSPTVMQ